jgi:transcriptional regulator with XRE-family HTH domain
MTPEEQALSHKIGHRLREARNAQQLSLSQLSARTGGRLGKPRISNYEQGLRRLGIEEAQILAEVLGTVSATYLLCLEAEKSPSETSLNQEERSLLHCFRGADERGRRAILDLAIAEHRAAVG